MPRITRLWFDYSAEAAEAAEAVTEAQALVLAAVLVEI